MKHLRFTESYLYNSFYSRFRKIVHLERPVHKKDSKIKNVMFWKKY